MYFMLKYLHNDHFKTMIAVYLQELLILLGIIRRRTMQILIHYTIQPAVFNYYNRDGTYEFNYSGRIAEVDKFYNKYNKVQDNLFFIVCYTNLSKTQYCIGKIFVNSFDKYVYSKVDTEIQNEIIEHLGILNVNTYDAGIYYKEYTITENLDFKSKLVNDYASKIKLRFFNWEELNLDVTILFDKMIALLFDETNVLNIATAYTPSPRYTDKILKKRYYDALHKIGFISEQGINTNLTILHGDIGEFFMHTLVSKFIDSEKNLKYLYPKLIFKTTPGSAVKGNDGTIYFPEKNEIYYMEAKFYSNLNSAIKKAVTSLEKHNETSQDIIDPEFFRNIKTSRLGEIIEVTDGVEEKLILFLMCDDNYLEKDVQSCIETNNILADLKDKFEVLIFIFPILDKKQFLKYFEEYSTEKGREYYDQK
ncbi:hypothetical protein RV09_GL000929 [Enterococcus moraviensis]|nr:hypothetical protein RV09_GL000929 [Enterococcus moraviensis]